MMRRSLLVGALGGAIAVVTRPAMAAAATYYDTVRSQFVNGNLGVGAYPFADDRIKLLLYNAAEMCAAIWKTGGDSNDPNMEGGVVVKHHRDYRSTPGYAGTTQYYTLAGSPGTVVGNNDFVGLDTTKPYAPTPAAVARGFVRFETGPLWPYSERMRVNNRGDVIVGWSLVRKLSASQAGDVVSTLNADFQPGDVGRFVCWGDFELGGTAAWADRIVEVLDAGRVRVETPRSVAAQGARVCTPRAVVRDGVLHLLEGVPGPVAQGMVALFVEGGALKAKAANGVVTVLAPG